MRLTERMMKHKVLTGIAIGTLAFLLGAFAYSVAAVLRSSQPAEAADVSVSVRVERCDCLVVFRPSQSLPGAGTPGDPYVVEGNKVELTVGVNGVGTITIVDENGNVLFTYVKTTEGYEDIAVHLTLTDGEHRLTALLDGNEIKFDGTPAVQYFLVQGFWIDVPGTGSFRLFGTEIDAKGAVKTGFVTMTVFLGLFLVFVLLKKRDEKERKAKAKTERRRAIAQINPKKIKKAGIIKK